MACIVANTGAPFIVVILATLLVGSLCGAVNAFVLTRFEELPPMIVTLATQIIFRGIAEIVLGSGGSISVTNTEGFAALGGKVGRVPYILFLVSDPWNHRSCYPWKMYLRTQSICNRYQPSCSLLLRNPCTEDPFRDLHPDGNHLRTVCSCF